MKHQLGIFLQLVVLSALPALIIYQLQFGIPLIVMPASLLAASVVVVPRGVTGRDGCGDTNPALLLPLDPGGVVTITLSRSFCNASRTFRYNNEINDH